MKNLLILIILIPYSLFSQQEDTIELMQCLMCAVNSHPLYQQRDLNTEISNSRNANYTKAWLPSISAEGQATYQSDAISISMAVPDITVQPPVFNQRNIESSPDQYKIYLSIEQPIYDGGITKQKKSLESTNLLNSQQQLEVEFHKTKLQVASVFFSIAALSKNIELVNLLHSDLTERYKTTGIAVENGVVLPTNLQILKAEILKVEQQSGELESKRKALVKILSRLTGIAINENTFLVWTNDLEVSESTGQRPEFQLLEYQKDIIESGLLLEKSVKRPKLFAFSQAGYGKPGLNMLNQNFDTYYLVGLGLKWKLLDWGELNNKERIAGFQREAIDLQKNNLNLNILIALENELANIENYRAAIKKDEEIIELRKEILKSALTQLNNGAITATQYITEANAGLQAKIELETHKIQLAQSLINYQLIKGDI